MLMIYGSYTVVIEKFGFKPINLNLNSSTTPLVEQVMTLIAYWEKQELIDGVEDVIDDGVDIKESTIGPLIDKISLIEFPEIPDTSSEIG